MKRRRFVLSVIGVVLLAASVVGVTAQTKLPRIEFRERTLANGMRVSSVADKSGPSVAINVRYDVCSKEVPGQRMCFAGLLEHFMIYSTEIMKLRMMDVRTDVVGG